MCLKEPLVFSSKGKIFSSKISSTMTLYPKRGDRLWCNNVTLTSSTIYNLMEFKGYCKHTNCRERFHQTLLHRSWSEVRMFLLHLIILFTSILWCSLYPCREILCGTTAEELNLTQLIQSKRNASIISSGFFKTERHTAFLTYYSLFIFIFLKFITCCLLSTQEIFSELQDRNVVADLKYPLF